MKRIQWLKPGVAWSMDTTEYGPDKIKITPLRDLASKYQVPTPLVQPTEDGRRIAEYLDLIFSKEGPPCSSNATSAHPSTARPSMKCSSTTGCCPSTALQAIPATTVPSSAACATSRPP